MAGEWQETIYGEFAADFVEDRLATLCDPNAGIQTGPFGSQLHKEDYVPVGTPIITVEHLGENRILHEDVPCVSDEDKARLSRYTLREGDIVFSRVGSVDRRALVRRNENGWLFSGRCLRVRPNPDKIDAGYLSYFFGLPLFKEHIRAIAVGATMPSLNTQILTNVIVPHPRDVGEQRAIAHILGSLDDKIELNRRMNETLEFMARAIFKSWFVDFDPVRAKAEGRKPHGMDTATAALFPDAFQDSSLGRIPKGWQVQKLRDIVGINERSITRDYPHQTIEYIDISSVSVGRLNATASYQLEKAPSRAKRLVSDGDTIWSCVRPNRKSFLFIHQPNSNLVVSTGFAVLTPKIVPPSYLYAWVTTNDFVDYLSYSADGSAYPAVRPDRFANAEILLPPMTLLKQFENYVQPMRHLITSNEQESRTLAAIRAALLPKLLSGEIRVKDAEKFVGANQ